MPNHGSEAIGAHGFSETSLQHILIKVQESFIANQQARKLK
jgi:hypothetical protein